MTPELTALALAILWQAVQFTLMAVPANLELGPGKTTSARDRARLGGSLEDMLSEKTARLYRAMNNHFEGLILFTAAVVVVTLSGQGTAFTAACGWTYLAARVLYVPAYAFGWRPWRSFIWFVGFTATLLMVISTLV
ncbi:MAPEG family protein [Jannaschia pohangensis]|uniref:MAPEG family protein n=1 Tax=Jannaschia pohangensis TaxID=390807 RepID=A0A1I3R0H7_9RHOB|nr:MAPEG family protein [Jannaschia pohangensis]SFJ39984.1 MAPEG family protein [Jannaschia pohangensis]